MSGEARVKTKLEREAPDGDARASGERLAGRERGPGGLAASLDAALHEGDGAVACLAEPWAQSTALWKLQVARARLDEVSGRAELFQAIEEIVAAIVGSEELAIYERDARAGGFRLALSSGVDRAALPRIEAGEGSIARALSTGETWVPTGGREPARGEDRLTACIPLRVGDAILGAICIFRLLPQKPGLDPDDHELFELLAAQAGRALLRAGPIGEPVPVTSSAVTRGC